MTIRGMSIGDRRMLDRQQDLTKAFYQNVLELSVPFIFIDAQFFLQKSGVHYHGGN